MARLQEELVRLQYWIKDQGLQVVVIFEGRDAAGKNAMFMYTDIEEAPWYVVNADIKRHARLNCIGHLLSMIDYKDLTPDPIELPPRQEDTGYERPPISLQTLVPEIY